MQQPVRLVYFQVRGRAQKIRHILQYCSIPYTQQLYKLTNEDANRWFNQIKPALIEKNTAVGLPHLVDQARIVAESDAICVYLCFKGNKPQLLGRDVDEKVQLATVYGVYCDCFSDFVDLLYGEYDQTNTFESALAQTPKNFEKHLTKLDGLLGKNEYMAGQITWVDFVVAQFLQVLGLMSSDIIKPFPKLIEYQKRIWSLPQLKAYFESDRFKERPCNGPMAAWQ